MTSKKSKNQMISDSSDESDNEITTKKFDRMLEKQTSYNTKKWTELTEGKIYKITDYRKIKTVYGESTILTLYDSEEVWCPEHLAKKIKDKEPPFYVRPLGLKPCTNNKKNKYHAYDLVYINGKIKTL